ncbi:MAG TPA: hypothetical protein VFJ18_01945 [Pararhizobium sp.]|nr:hypothetical protein [Pararhizobium sp.]
MIKLVVSGIWICLLSLGSVYFSMQMPSEKAEGNPPAPFFGGLDYIRGDLISVPVISHGAVHGYFLTRLVYTVDPKELSALSVPPKDLITDELYTFLVGNQVIDFPEMDNFNLDAFRKGIKDALNKRVGKDVFRDVLVEQIDYLSKQDIHNNNAGPGLTVSDAKPIADSKGATH